MNTIRKLAKRTTISAIIYYIMALIVGFYFILCFCYFYFIKLLQITFYEYFHTFLNMMTTGGRHRIALMQLHRVH